MTEERISRPSRTIAAAVSSQEVSIPSTSIARNKECCLKIVRIILQRFDEAAKGQYSQLRILRQLTAALPPHSAERLRLSAGGLFELRGCASRTSIASKDSQDFWKGGAFPHCAAAEPRLQWLDTGINGELQDS